MSVVVSLSAGMGSFVCNNREPLRLGGGRGGIDKALHSSCPAVDQDYIDVGVDGVALHCLGVSLRCPDLHSEKSSADATRAPSGDLMHV